MNGAASLDIAVRCGEFLLAGSSPVGGRSHRACAASLRALQHGADESGTDLVARLETDEVVIRAYDGTRVGCAPD